VVETREGKLRASREGEAYAALIRGLREIDDLKRKGGMTKSPSNRSMREKVQDYQWPRREGKSIHGLWTYGNGTTVKEEGFDEKSGQIGLLGLQL